MNRRAFLAGAAAAPLAPKAAKAYPHVSVVGRETLNQHSYDVLRQTLDGVPDRILVNIPPSHSMSYVANSLTTQTWNWH